jgi:hypothetical protein
MDLGFDTSSFKAMHMASFDKVSRMELNISCLYDALQIRGSHHRTEKHLRTTDILVLMRTQLLALDVDPILKAQGLRVREIEARKELGLRKARLASALTMLDNCAVLIAQVLGVYVCLCVCGIVCIYRIQGKHENRKLPPKFSRTPVEFFEVREFYRMTCACIQQ